MKGPISIATLLLAGLCAAPVHAETPPTEAETAASSNAEGMRAYIDPETGELTSQPSDNVRALELVPQMHLIEEIQHANGMTEWRFNGQANEAMVATVGKDGTVSAHCAVHGKADGHTTGIEESNHE